jgi:hypothetical protein
VATEDWDDTTCENGGLAATIELKPQPQETPMRYIISLSFTFLLLLAPALSTEYVTIDGVWWQAATDLQKVTLVQGMIEGLDEGWMAGASAVSYYSPSAKLQTAEAHRLRYSKSFGDYVHLIDAVETDNAATKLPISTIMVCLSDKNPNSTDCVRAWEKVDASSP